MVRVVFPSDDVVDVCGFVLAAQKETGCARTIVECTDQEQARKLAKEIGENCDKMVRSVDRSDLIHHGALSLSVFDSIRNDDCLFVPILTSDTDVHTRAAVFLCLQACERALVFVADPALGHIPRADSVALAFQPRDTAEASRVLDRYATVMVSCEAASGGALLALAAVDQRCDDFSVMVVPRDERTETALRSRHKHAVRGFSIRDIETRARTQSPLVGRAYAIAAIMESQQAFPTSGRAARDMRDLRATALSRADAATVDAIMERAGARHWRDPFVQMRVWMAERVRSHVATTGSMPSRRSVDADQRQLANHLKKFEDGVVRARRDMSQPFCASAEHILAVAVPGWMDRIAKRAGAEHGADRPCGAAVCTFFRENGRFPSRASPDRAERRLGTWVYMYRMGKYANDARTDARLDGLGMDADGKCWRDYVHVRDKNVAGE